MKSKWILVFGVVFGLIAATLVYLKLESEPGEDRVGQDFMKLSSDQNLAAGDRLLPDLVSPVTIPLDFDQVKSVAVPYTQEVESWLVNNDVRVSKDVIAGSFILHEHLIDDPADRFAKIISVKGRAISIPVSEITSVSYFIEPGSRVDILTTFSVQKQASERVGFGFAQSLNDADRVENSDNLTVPSEHIVTRTLMQNMLVLAVGQATTRNAYLNGRRGYSSITLDVTPEEAEMLTFLMSQSQNGFNLVLRNPRNIEEQDIQDVDWDAVMGRP